jgi:hypothetical protein
MTKQPQTHHDRGFACGVATACGIIIQAHDNQVVVREVLNATGLDTRQKLKRAGVDDYDLDLLRAVLRDIKRRKAGR